MTKRRGATPMTDRPPVVLMMMMSRMMIVIIIIVIWSEMRQWRRNGQFSVEGIWSSIGTFKWKCPHQIKSVHSCLLLQHHHQQSQPISRSSVLLLSILCSTSAKLVKLYLSCDNQNPINSNQYVRQGVCWNQNRIFADLWSLSVQLIIIIFRMCSW